MSRTVDTNPVDSPSQLPLLLLSDPLLHLEGQPTVDFAPLDRVDKVQKAHIVQLEPAASVLDIEVLDVADGSISTLRTAVEGDRPVLVWFYSPH